MSYYSTINGHISVKTEDGEAIIKQKFDSWMDSTNRKYGSLVKLKDNVLMFSGYYRNAGRAIDPCLQELIKAGELQDVEIDESTTDGMNARFRYFMQDGVPVVEKFGY